MGRTHDVAVGGKWAGGRGENTEGSLAIASFGADGCQRGLSRLATFSSHLVDLDGLPSSQRSSIASAASCWHPSLSAAWRVRRMYVHLEAVGLQNCLWWAAGPQKRADRQWRQWVQTAGGCSLFGIHPLPPPSPSTRPKLKTLPGSLSSPLAPRRPLLTASLVLFCSCLDEIGTAWLRLRVCRDVAAQSRARSRRRSFCRRRAALSVRGRRKVWTDRLTAPCPPGTRLCCFTYTSCTHHQIRAVGVGARVARLPRDGTPRETVPAVPYYGPTVRGIQT